MGTKTVFQRIEQKNRLFFALMNMHARKLSLHTQNRIVRVLWPKQERKNGH